MLVTGPLRGIGRETARRLAELEREVAALGRSFEGTRVGAGEGNT